MFTPVYDKYGNLKYFSCLSTDTKRTKDYKPYPPAQNGDPCIEIDTGNVYLYDLENDTWLKTFSAN